MKDAWWELLRHRTEDEQMITKLWNELEKQYGSPKRHYHNADHLQNLLDQAKKFQDQVEDYEVLLYSIWYHDLIYNTLRQDNESKSAKRAKQVLSQLGFSEAQIKRCAQQIVLTKTHKKTKDSDAAWFLDFDLSVLAWNWRRYEQYTESIRQEYALYPNFLYKKGRRQVLAHFLEKEHIFQTAHYQKHFEAAARANLNRELELLIAR